MMIKDMLNDDNDEDESPFKKGGGIQLTETKFSLPLQTRE